MSTPDMTSRDEVAVLAAANQLVAAFARHDTDAYFNAFAPEASFIFHSHPEVLPDRAAYRRLWAHWETTQGFRVRSCASSNPVVQLRGDVAVFHHQVRTTLHFATEGDVTLNERETIVWARQPDGQWLATHEHLSAGGEA